MMKFAMPMRIPASFQGEIPPLSVPAWMAAICFMIAGLWSSPARAQMLEQKLLAEPSDRLAAAARMDGDPKRGAVVFFQAYLACTKCHAVTGKSEDSAQRLGPDVATQLRELTDADLVESLLVPSKKIRKGFQATTIIKTDGTQLVGIVEKETKEGVVIRDVGRLGEFTTIPAGEIEETAPVTQSIMPSGQVNQLASRQEFLDLIRYLMDLREGGPDRAKALQPPVTLVALKLPEYEQHVDHAELLRRSDDQSYQRGAAIYARVCANCHGTRERPGSLPTSLKFASGKFKNGSDPLSLYRTLTRGFGLMAPQTWMVPRQKYDVIHYLREEYLRTRNPSQYVDVDAAYLASLPSGDTLGPEPNPIEVWSAMDYGPHLMHTIELPPSSAKLAAESASDPRAQLPNIAYKGIAVRLNRGSGGVARGNHWMIYDEDTMRLAGAWSEELAGSPLPQNSTGFVDWRGVQFNGEHNIHPHAVGRIAFENRPGPGWGDPRSRSFADDRRVEGRDGRRYGPLPKDWLQFRGIFLHEQQVVISYVVAGASVLELPRMVEYEGLDLLTSPGAKPGSPSSKQTTNPPTNPRDPIAADKGLPSVFLRTFEIGPRPAELLLAVAHRASAVDAGVVPEISTLEWTRNEFEDLCLRIPAGEDTLRFTVWMSERKSQAEKSAMPDPARWIENPAMDLESLTHGGPPRWPQELLMPFSPAVTEGPFAVDELVLPESNPWMAQVRPTGLDFFPDRERLAVCSWDGDVWFVDLDSQGSAGPSTNQNGNAENPSATGPQARWRRIASGMFQPLGLKIVNGKIHLTCRDQLVVLHDLNGDEEIDFYQCLNNDHQVTEHFHEFAMGLQVDQDGNFYYAKSARHALTAIVPHHGTLLRVSPDGQRTDILATGFRAANGVCLNPDGSFVVTDQEGHWNPKNRINWVDGKGASEFYGNLFGYTDVTDPSDSAMRPPLCWITNQFDRSPAELLWVPQDKWGPLGGALLNLSYGYGKVFVVPHETVNGLHQGGMCELPIPNFPTGIMRGRFDPWRGDLFVCGMFSWAGSVTKPGGLYRIRATGMPTYSPIGLHARRDQIDIEFMDELDRESAEDVKNYSVSVWSLKRTENYGSEHYDEHALVVRTAKYDPKKRKVELSIDGLAPTWCMEIKYSLRGKDGQPFTGVIHNTIHNLAP